MTDEQLRKARALVERRDWIWTAGLAVLVHGVTPFRLQHCHGSSNWRMYEGPVFHIMELVPDLRDPLTMAWCRLLTKQQGETAHDWFD